MSEGYRLSPQQRQLWISGQQRHAAQLLLTIDGPLDTVLLAHNLHELKTRYEILRTDFQFIQGMKLPVQVVTEDEQLDLPEFPLPQGDSAALEEFLSKYESKDELTTLQAALLAFSNERHVLVLRMPALYADSVSLTVLMNEIVAGYQALLTGSDLPEAGMQYADISQWLNDLLTDTGTEHASLPAYLAQVEQLMTPQLPFAVSTGETGAGLASLSATLSSELQADLLRLAQRYSVSITDVLLSCWNVLLWQLSLQQNFAIGTIFNGRNYRELEEALGPLALWVPLYAEPTAVMTWKELVQRIHALNADISQHQEDFLWEKLAQQYQFNSQAPHFGVGFEYFSQAVPGAVAHVTFSVLKQTIGTDQCDLKLVCCEKAHDLLLTLHYKTALYDARTVERLLDQLSALLRNVLQQPEARLDMLEVAGIKERMFLLEEMNRTAMEGEPVCLHTLIEQQTSRTPQAIALIEASQQLTYAELAARTDQFACTLQDAGVGPDVPVAIFAERSLLAIVAMIATLKAGGAYVPLDPAFSSEQVITLLEKHDIRTLVTTQSSMQASERPDLKVIELNTELLACLPDGRQPIRSVAPEHLAYIIFTSGSTGAPKGAMIEHRQISNYVRGIIQRLAIQPESTFALISTLAADLGNTTLFAALCTGGTLHIIDPEMASDPDGLTAYVTTYPLDYLKIVPTHLTALLSGTQPAALVPRKSIILGGEVLSWGLVERLQRLRPDCTIVNHYGPSETTVGAFAEIVQLDERQGTTCPIGTPLANTQAYLLNANLQPVPTLVPGEIFIGGVGVGRGYLGQLKLTEQSFLPDPFSATPGARMYRTGDLGRYLPDGHVEFLGRTDDQIKIRGFRVEPAGVAAQICQHPDVKDALVLPTQIDQEHKQLTAYVVPTEAASQTYKGRDRYLLPNNLAIVQLNGYETDFFYEQIFTQNTEMQHGIALPEKPVVFDIGANIGLFTLFISQFYPEAHIYSFEPIPPISEVLKLNAELYSSAAETYQFGFSDHRGDVTFTYYPQSSCQSGYYADINEDMEVLRAIMLNQQQGALADFVDTAVAERSEATQFVCRLETLSAFIQEHAIEHIDLLKIDVEKSELDILLGIAEADWAKIDQIVIEAHDIQGHVARVSALLERQGYQMVVEQSSLIENTALHNIYASRKKCTQSDKQPDFQRQFSHPYLTEDALADFLAVKLSAYQLPSEYMFLSSFPLTANGKIDRQALLKSVVSKKTDHKQQELPRSTVENVLAEIWREVLGRKDPIGIHDNFFSLGGDSILAILVVGHAAKAGLHLVTKQLFQYPTIAELALLVEDTPAFQAEQGIVSGEVPLTPAQHWFFDTVTIERQHWNQAVLLEYGYRLQAEILQGALQSLLTQHDMLRARFFPTETGWQQVIDASVPEFPLHLVDLTSSSREVQQQELQRVASELQATLDLEQGKLVQAVLFDLGSEQRLFIVIHHLVVDGVSWRILLEDVHTAYQQLQHHHAVQLPPKTSSFKQWSHDLTAYAHSAALQEELAYWVESVPDQIGELKVDNPEGENSRVSERSISFQLTAEETQFLLQQVPQVFQTHVNDVLLAALAQAFAACTHESYLLLDLEGHGREDILERVDLSRTVAWFTLFFPVALDLRQVETPAEALKYTKELLRNIPQQGIGYGLLRYLDPETAALLQAKPQAQVRFNYLGQIEQTDIASSFLLVEEEIGATQSPQGLRSHLFDITGVVVDGHLRFNWLYSEAMHNQDTMQQFALQYAEALHGLLAYCQTPDAGGYTPSDFPRSSLNQDELDDLLAQLSE